MSKYRIEKTSHGIKITCDDKPFNLIPMQKSIKTFFDFGDHTDSTMNLAYAILHHCIGETKAGLLCQEFVGEFLITSENQIEISSEKIESFADLIMKAQYEAQQAVRNTKRIK